MATFARTGPANSLPASPRFYLAGDSILHGIGQYSWRALLFQALTQAGYNPDFRGSIACATDDPALGPTIAGNSHSGLNGSSGVNWYSTYWDNNGGNSDFPKSFPTPAEYPQIILIAVGANDTDSALVATDFCRLMDKAATTVPTAKILMATATRSSVAGAYATQAAQVRIEVATRRSRGMNVTLVDANAVVLNGGDWSDGLHLTASGHRKVAEWAWIPAVLSMLASCRT
jgi:hypothetical protein